MRLGRLGYQYGDRVEIVYRSFIVAASISVLAQNRDHTAANTGRHKCNEI